MHAPTTAARALADSVCTEHRCDPAHCGADRDVVLYAAAGVLVVAGVAAGFVALSRRSRD